MAVKQKDGGFYTSTLILIGSRFEMRRKIKSPKKCKICLHNKILITSHRDPYNPRWRHPMIHTNFRNCQLQSGCFFVQILQNLSSVGDYQLQCDANIEDLLKFTAKHNLWSHLREQRPISWVVDNTSRRYLSSNPSLALALMCQLAWF